MLENLIYQVSFITVVFYHTYKIMWFQVQEQIYGRLPEVAPVPPHSEGWCYIT